MVISGSEQRYSIRVINAPFTYWPPPLIAFNATERREACVSSHDASPRTCAGSRRAMVLPASRDLVPREVKLDLQSCSTEATSRIARPSHHLYPLWI